MPHTDRTGYDSERYFRNLEENRRARRERYYVVKRSNPAALLLRSARARAKSKGIPCTITAEELTIPETCPVLGIKLEQGQGKLQDCSPSLDQIIPGKGYVRGNVRVISYRANRLKCDATEEELALVLADVRNLKIRS